MSDMTGTSPTASRVSRYVSRRRDGWVDGGGEGHVSVTVVPVLLEGPRLARRVDLRMSRIDLRWRLDDVVYEGGGTLRTLLAGDPAPAPGTRR